MRPRALALALAAGAVLAQAAGAAGPEAVVEFTVERPSSVLVLPSAAVPNTPGGLALPAALSTPPVVPQQLSFAELQGLWQSAGAAYGIPWHVLAAINKVESNFGRNMGPSSAGAVGWMQFMPETWHRWGMDGSGDGLVDPWNAQDAIFSAARYLAAAGGANDLQRAIFAYNHAQWYVDQVLEIARLYGSGGFDVAFSLDRLGLRLDEAEAAVTRTSERLGVAREAEHRLARRTAAWALRAKRASLLSDRLLLQKRTAQTDARRAGAAGRASRLAVELRRAERTLARAREAARTASFAPAAAALLAAPAYLDGWVFPVGGGAGAVTVSRTHHDYRAADIAAPSGSPLYALADGVVTETWPEATGRCGIGFSFATEDGRNWTYCHLSYLEPTVLPGTALPVGAPVGFVGSTGNSTGPHLHLQLNPTTSYPQEEAWFQAFAGTAFSWAEPAQPLDGDAATAGPVFAVVESTAVSAGPVIGFRIDDA